MWFGEWEIDRWEHLRGTAILSYEFAQSQIGLGMSLTASEARFDWGLLWLTGRGCSDPEYRWAASDEFIGHGWQALLPVDHPHRLPGGPHFLVVECDGSPAAGFQVTNSAELVAYYDGYYFFFTVED
jgi:hypothetical protein